ncbi:MAG: leucine-rich repeat domain-containing protein [Candidatus Thorarchaeota archaeon]
MDKVVISGINTAGETEDFEVEIQDEDGLISVKVRRRHDYVSLDLTPISSMTSLQTLTIFKNFRLTSLDLTPLSNLTDLQYLLIGGNLRLTSLDLTPLSNLMGLQSLLIGGNLRLTSLDLTPLSNLTGLHTLSIGENPSLTRLDLTPLLNLIDLRELSIKWNEGLSSLDLAPLTDLTRLQSLDISRNMGLSSLDLAPLADLTSLQSLNLSWNTRLTRLDLTPLSRLTSLQSLNISDNHELTKLDLTPLSSLTGLQKLDLWENRGLKSLDCFLSKSTLDSLMPLEYLDTVEMPIDYRFTPLGSFQYIAQLLPIVEEHEETWKMHHLIQSTLELLGLEWIGILDMDRESLAVIIQHWEDGDFRESARNKFLSYWRDCIESGGTTIGISIEHVYDLPELAVMAERVIAMRSHEMEKLVLSKEGNVIDLRPLYLTAYGHQVLQALEMDLTCTADEFEPVSGALEKLGFDLNVEDQSQQEQIARPPNMSVSLCNYIFRLVEHPDKA